jgi:hypothetical protein
MKTFKLTHLKWTYVPDDFMPGEGHFRMSETFVCEIEAPTRRSAMAKARQLVKTRMLFTGIHPTHDLEEVS